MTSADWEDAHLPKVASGPCGALKLAVTDRLVVTDRLQLPLPVQSPLQPSKLWPLVALAVRIKLVPLG
jgi:hypothetical protein